MKSRRQEAEERIDRLKRGKITGEEKSGEEE